MYGSAYLNRPPPGVPVQGALSSRGTGMPPGGYNEIHDVKKVESKAGMSFQYNGRVASVLLPSVLVLVGYGGPLVAGVLLGGCLLAYMMDVMRYKEGSFLTVWMSLALANICMGYSTLFLDNEYSIRTAILGLLVHSGVLLLTGVWATLQFKWIQFEYPAVVVAFEKMLMSSCIPVCGGVLFWGLITHNGISSAPFLVCGIVCTMYAVFARPLQSSFSISPHRFHPASAMVQGRGGWSATLKTLQEPLDGAISFLCVLMMPCLVYVAAHHQAIWSWTHLWSIVLLACGPLLFMSAIPRGLWWLGTGGASVTAKRVFVLVALAGVLAGIEGRIVFHSFGQYIKLAPPLSYVTITLAMYGIAAVALLYISGSIGNQTAALLLGPIAMVSTAMGCMIIGVPLWVLPAPLVAAAGIAMYCESKAPRDYILIILGSLCTCAWFLWHHFWFLDINLNGMSLQSICMLIFLAMIPAVIIPGLAHSRLPGIGPLMTIHALILVILEEHLYSGDYLELTYDVHPMFPASLIVATSFLGIFLARKMHDMQYINTLSSFALQCIYGAKVWIIFVPETKMTIPVIGYALASLHPLFISHNGDIQSHESSASRCLAMSVLMFLSVASSRFAIFDALHILFDRKPSESLAAGTLLIAFAAGLLPMVTRHCSRMRFPRRAIILVGSLGLLMILLRPPLPINGGSECPKLPMALCPRLWDAGHDPNHEQDDIAVYGDGIRRREHWPLWFIVIASIFGILSATSEISPGTLFAPKRLIQGSISGLLVGAYMALEFFPGIFQMQSLIIGSCLIVSLLVVVLSVPSRGSTILFPFFGIVWAACLPMALFILSVSQLPPLPHDMIRLHPDTAEGIEVEHIRRNASKMYVLCCIASQALVLAFACKLRLGSKNATARSHSSMLGVAQDAIYIDKAAEFLGGYVTSTVNRSTIGSLVGNKYQSIKAMGMPYLPEACNLLTLYCFCLCLWVNTLLDGEHADIMMLVLCPILLLLSQDSLMFRSLTDKRRYFPPYVAGAGALTFTSIGSIIADMYSFEEGINIDMAEFLTHAFIILLCIPSLLAMVNYLWQHRRPQSLLPIGMGLVASGGICLTTIESVKMLAGFSGATSFVLITIVQQEKRSSFRAL